MLSFIFSASLALVSYDNSVLNTGTSLNTGKDAVEVQKIPGSKIVSSTYDIKPNSATEFLVGQIVRLEKIIDAKSGVKETNDAMRNIVSGTLDLDFLGRRALVTYWSRLGELKEGAAKQAQYMSLFKELVEENYLEQARKYMSGSYEIPLTNERTAKEFSYVTGRIKKTDVDLILEFKLRKAAEKFQVVDVKLDETSLESTYRSSFNRIIRKKGGLEEGFPELIRVMQKRLAELRSGEATRL